MKEAKWVAQVHAVGAEGSNSLKSFYLIQKPVFLIIISAVQTDFTHDHVSAKSQLP